MNYQHEIEAAIQISSGLLPGRNEAQKFVEILEKQGLSIQPITNKQVHDIDRLILAEKIVATRMKIQKMRATEVFENHGKLVKQLDADVAEYFTTYANPIEMEVLEHE